MGRKVQMQAIRESMQTCAMSCALQGKTELPSEEAMVAAIEAQHEFNRTNFTQVKRHALMVRPVPRLHGRGSMSWTSPCSPSRAPALTHACCHVASRLQNAQSDPFMHVHRRVPCLVQVEFHRYLLQLRLARCPKGKGPLGRRLWKAKTVLSFCLGNKC